MRVGDGDVELLDGLLRPTSGAVLVRLVRSVGPPVPMVHEVSLGGFEVPTAAWDEQDDGGPQDVTGSLLGHALRVGGDGDTVVDGAVVRTVLHAVSHEWRGVLVSVDEPSPPAAADAAAQLEGAVTTAEEFAATCQLPSHHPELGERALAVLTACTAVASGAIVASPTTSLPEVVGGDRQFDYRYCWHRDSAQAVAVASMLGKHESAAALLRFLSDLGPDRLLESPLYDVRGGPVPAERDLVGVAGWGGSRPVRIGNGAAGQVQHDVLGLVMESIAAFEDQGDGLRRGDWAIVRAFADRALVEPGASNGIWELRDPADLVSADLGRWLALDRAVALAGRARRWPVRRRRWAAAAAATRDRVLDALRPDGGLPHAYGDDHHDASALLAVIYGLVAADDDRASRLVDATLVALGDGPFVRRYDAGVHDGFAPGEGAFVPCSWWAVSALAVVGRHQEAVDRADAMLALLDPLQAEEVDPASGAALGNVPLVWSHTEAARAMVLIDRHHPAG